MPLKKSVKNKKELVKLLKSEDPTNVIFGLKIAETLINPENCIYYLYLISTLPDEGSDERAELKITLRKQIAQIIGEPLKTSMSMNTKIIACYLREGNPDDDSINAFLQYYMEFVRYSITHSTSFDFIPAEELNIFDR